MKKSKSKLMLVASIGFFIGNIAFYFYNMNTFNVKSSVITIEKSLSPVEVNVEELESTKDLSEVKELVMKQTQSDKGLVKLGYLSIPKLQILIPIFDKGDAESNLLVGGGLTGQWNTDTQKLENAVFGIGNFSIAGHNFNDGKTAFSPLQQNINLNQPYLDGNEFKTNNWLNGTDLYLTNGEMIYKYIIENQFIVNYDNLTPMKVNKEHHYVTLITCLFPADTLRIITPAFYVGKYEWNDSAKEVISLFDLRNQKTNATLNDAVEEGVNKK